MNKIEQEWEALIKIKGFPTVDKDTRYISKKEAGLWMFRLSVFWRYVFMSWLRRLTTTKSTWRGIHL